MSKPPTQLDARAMHSLLRGHLLPPSKPAGGILADEIEAPDGRRRADAIWAPFNRGVGLTGYEIKVSRSDVMAELADPTKSEPWLKYCSYWFLFVADPAMVEGLEIPDRWGIVSPPSGRARRSLTVLRSAPKLHPIDTGEAWHRLFTWYHYGTEQRLYSAQREVDYAKAETQRWRDQRDNQFARSDPAIAWLREIKAAVDERGGAEHWYPSSEQSKQLMIDTICDAAAVRRWTQDALREVHEVHDALGRVAAGVRDRGDWESKLTDHIQQLMDQLKGSAA